MKPHVERAERMTGIRLAPFEIEQMMRGGR